MSYKYFRSDIVGLLTQSASPVNCQSEGWERIIAVPGSMSCQGSGLGQWIHGGGGNSGNSMPQGTKPMETVQYELPLTTVMVRSALAEYYEHVPNTYDVFYKKLRKFTNMNPHSYSRMWGYMVHYGTRSQEQAHLD
jgi:hypothetical protein